jgi:polysaccharide export outer membrane protein
VQTFYPVAATAPALPAAVPAAGGLKPDAPLTAPVNDQALSPLAAGTRPETASETSSAAPVEAVPSSVEAVINAVDKTLENVEPLQIKQRNLTQFGYNFFEAGTGYSPLIDTPVGPDYVLGPGDSIVLSSWGSLDGTFALEVNRSGEIVLPRVGTIRVWGLSFAQLPEVIRTNLAKTFKNPQFNVSMGKLRLIRVYVVGEVKNPGSYDIGGLSTLLNVLASAGGPTKNGTLRSIQVKRKGQSVETVDLYDFFLKGDKSRDLRLQSGDTVYVPTLGKVAGIDGNVRRPAIYELNGEKSLKELVALADGILPTAYLHRVQISRVTAHNKKQAADLSIDPNSGAQAIDQLLETVLIQDLDTVTIFPIDTLLRGHVRLTGYLLRPGDYAIKDGMRLRDLIPADALLPEYYGPVAELTRFSSPDLRPERSYFHLAQALSGDPVQNLELKEFDVIRVFSRWEMEEIPKVRVSGEVHKPGEYRVFDKMTLRDLIYAAGNVKKTAYLKSAEITRSVINKEGVKSYIINVDLDQALQGNLANNVLIADMDEVVVRRLPDWQEETERYATLRGEVRFPGTYPILKGEKLSSLLARAGGYTDKAYLKGAKLTRKAVAEVQQKRMDEVINRTEQDIVQKQQELASIASSKEELEATKSALEGLRRSLEKVRNSKAEGRVSVTLAPLDRLQQTASDVELMGGDTLEIPQSPDAVMIMGEVYNPTTVIYAPGNDVSFYLKKAGGATMNAERDEMYVIRADGTVQSRHESKRFLFYDGFLSAELESGDTVVVPQKLEKVAWMRDIKDIAMIIGQIALAAGVVVAAGI